jgi:aminocarboxymuconate-semialdehyde decarboxylase
MVKVSRNRRLYHLRGNSTMKIDVHSHFVSEKFAHRLEKRQRFPYGRTVDGRYRFHCCEGMVMPMTPAMFDMERKIADMDTLGIDIAVLSLGVPGPELFPGRQADEIARFHNDLLAEIIARQPDRFWGYATLGFGTVDNAMKELDRCINDLKFRGLQLFSNIRGRPLDLPEFRPIFARMAELRRPIFIHPTVPMNRNYMTDLVPISALAFTVDTTLAAMRLALSGALTEFADAPVIIPHVGGTVPYLMTRLDGSLFTHPRGIKEASPILKKLYTDTVVHSVEPLRWCYETIGAGQMLFGTDHPYGQWAYNTTVAVDRLECTPEEREQILHGNAERLFRPVP